MGVVFCPYEFIFYCLDEFAPLSSTILNLNFSDVNE